MAKKTSGAKKRASPRASKMQVDRIDELGAQLFQDRWPEVRDNIMRAGVLTPNRARALIYDFMKTLGGKV